MPARQRCSIARPLRSASSSTELAMPSHWSSRSEREKRMRGRAILFNPSRGSTPGTVERSMNCAPLAGSSSVSLAAGSLVGSAGVKPSEANQEPVVFEKRPTWPTPWPCSKISALATSNRPMPEPCQLLRTQTLYSSASVPKFRMATHPAISPSMSATSNSPTLSQKNRRSRSIRNPSTMNGRDIWYMASTSSGVAGRKSTLYRLVAPARTTGTLAWAATAGAVASLNIGLLASGAADVETAAVEPAAERPAVAETHRHYYEAFRLQHLPQRDLIVRDDDRFLVDGESVHSDPN